MESCGILYRSLEKTLRVLTAVTLSELTLFYAVSGQYVIDTKNGVLTIKRFDKQNEGKYSCAALVLLGNEERVAVSSSFKMYIGTLSV